MLWWVVQYVVETRFTGQEHEVPGPSQQQVVGHQERIISGASIPAPPQVYLLLLNVFQCIQLVFPATQHSLSVSSQAPQRCCAILTHEVRSADVLACQQLWPCTWLKHMTPL